MHLLTVDFCKFTSLYSCYIDIKIAFSFQIQFQGYKERCWHVRNVNLIIEGRTQLFLIFLILEYALNRLWTTNFPAILLVPRTKSCSRINILHVQCVVCLVIAGAREAWVIWRKIFHIPVLVNAGTFSLEIWTNFTSFSVVKNYYYVCSRPQIRTSVRKLYLCL